MTAIVAIDPGAHEAGWAYYEPQMGTFLCTLIKNKPQLQGQPWWHTQPVHVVVELPQQRGRHSPVKMSDLIRLAATAGQLGGPRCEFATVSEWKGNEAKESMHARLLTILSESELKVVQNLDCIPSKKHNVMDAICLLMWRLGRLKTKGSKRHAPPKKEV